MMRSSLENKFPFLSTRSIEIFKDVETKYKDKKENKCTVFPLVLC
jgi:hypothetical protein